MSVNRYMAEGNPYMGGTDPKRQVRPRRERVRDGWEIEETPTGYDLRLDRRAVQYDCDNIEEALRILLRRDPGAEEVTVVALDGYRESRPLSRMR